MRGFWLSCSWILCGAFWGPPWVHEPLAVHVIDNAPALSSRARAALNYRSFVLTNQFLVILYSSTTYRHVLHPFIIHLSSSGCLLSSPLPPSPRSLSSVHSELCLLVVVLNMTLGRGARYAFNRKVHSSRDTIKQTLPCNGRDLLECSPLPTRSSPMQDITPTMIRATASQAGFH